MGVKIIVACSAHIRKQATKTVSKDMLQRHVNIYYSENTVPLCQHEISEDRLLPLIS